jgi:hypothetical protein
MIELFTAKSGAPSLKVDGVALHSPYDPRREAQRFVREALGNEPPSAVIVLGECLGHISQAVSEAHPRALVLAAVYSAEIARAARFGQVPGWDPSNGEGLEEFLRSHLGELQIEGLRVIEWPPSARAFRASSTSANEAVRRVVQELNGSLVTTVAAGRVWLRNCFANFIHIDRVLSGPLSGDGRPIVIAAPGPSLEQAAPLLAGIRDRVALWALPSSCPSLLDRGLLPDLVILTDPGFYALHHLQFASPSCPLAMPLSAARGTWGLHPRPASIFLEQPFAVERSLLLAAGLSAPRAVPHGTVTATAIDLALSSTRAPVIVAGLDLGSVDLLSHVRPNAFDSLLHLQSSRLQPHTGQWFLRSTDLGSASTTGRASGFRTSAALRTYAGWLATGFQGARGRLYRLLPSEVPLSSMAPLDGQALHRLLSAFPCATEERSLAPVEGYPDRPARGLIAQRLLGEWRQQVTEAQDAISAGNVDLGRYPIALDLAHLVSPRRLVDTLRKSRLRDAAAARSAAVETLQECSAFLGVLGEKLRA